MGLVPGRHADVRRRRDRASSPAAFQRCSSHPPFARSASCLFIAAMAEPPPTTPEPDIPPPDPCTQCGSSSAQMVLETRFVFYFRCPSCGSLWTIERPAADLFEDL